MTNAVAVTVIAVISKTSAGSPMPDTTMVATNKPAVIMPATYSCFTLSSAIHHCCMRSRRESAVRVQNESSNGAPAAAVNSPAGSFKGSDTAHVRIDPSGERAVLCGWVSLDKGGASIRATRWLSEARLTVGDIKVTALFIAPVDRKPGDGLNAGCLRLDEGIKPAADAALKLEGPAVRE